MRVHFPLLFRCLTLSVTSFIFHLICLVFSRACPYSTTTTNQHHANLKTHLFSFKLFAVYRAMLYMYISTTNWRKKDDICKFRFRDFLSDHLHYLELDYLNFLEPYIKNATILPHSYLHETTIKNERNKICSKIQCL